ncbi:L-arabinose isomerase [Litorihabitans aurantiacus]|uniref:L-arabinose isomerase n=1 Tax=Litorihabitans aurantiacus TaxID=1930061 RepID=A0AA37XDN8_9MICO|nr:L-arabinose isomerase [Litorihabitans aurantiacus]GMA30332.1 L-arabinose isomerase [Litorihabitans aurantiacus]
MTVPPTNPTTLDPFAGREIWFLTGSQHLYGPETLQEVEANSREIVAHLDGGSEIPVKVVFKQLLTDTEAIRAVADEANADPAVVGVIAWMHTFSPAKMWITGLDALRKPFLHLHTQANVDLPWGEIDMDFMNTNQAAHGDREFAYMASRLGVARKTVVGHASQSFVREEIGTWARAATAWAHVRGLKLARFGDNMRFVGVTEGDKTEAERVFGVQVNTWGVNEVAARVAQVTDAEVDALVETYVAEYDVSPELLPGGERHQSLRDGAAIEAGMRSFLVEGGFGAFTTSFEDLGDLKQLPGLAVQRLMAEGYGFGAEGDWKTAILVRAAKVMGHGLPGGASLMEDYTYEMADGRQKILGAHMLEVCPSLTTARPSLEVHELGIGGKADPVRLVFDTDAGPAIVVALSDMRERFRLVANVVDVVEPDAPLPHLPVARAVWVPQPDFRTSAQAWLTAGGAHHTVMSTAVGAEAFEDFAEIARTELVLIDAGTTIRELKKELRWNAAYFRLAQGF